MDMIGMVPDFAILCFHQQELEIIRCSQVLRNSCLANRFFPEDVALLPTQAIPILLVVINDCTDKIAFELLQRHSTSFCRGFRIMDTVTGIGEYSLKTLSHPAKDGLDGSFRRRAIWRGLLRDDPQAVHQHLACPLGGKNLPTVVKDRGWLPIAGPIVVAPGLQDEAIFRFQGSFDEPHVILLREWPQSDDSTHDRGGLHAHEHGGVNAAGNRDAITGYHIEFHTVLIDLGQLCWCGNGEGKGERGLPFAPRPSLFATRLAHRWFLLEREDVTPDLIVTRKRESHTSVGS